MMKDESCEHKSSLMLNIFRTRGLALFREVEFKVVMNCVWCNLQQQ